MFASHLSSATQEIRSVVCAFTLSHVAHASIIAHNRRPGKVTSLLDSFQTQESLAYADERIEVMFIAS